MIEVKEKYNKNDEVEMSQKRKSVTGSRVMFCVCSESEQLPFINSSQLNSGV